MARTLIFDSLSAFCRRAQPLLRAYVMAPLRCACGATALEFAIVISLTLLLLTGIVEYSLIMYGSSVLEGALTAAAREGRTGSCPGTCAGGRTAYVDSIMQKLASGLLDPSKLVITAQSYPDFSAVMEPCLSPALPPCPGTPGVNFTDLNGDGVWDMQAGTPGVGGSDDVVAYTVTYPWPINVPLLYPVLDGGGTGVYTMTSSTLVKNEPFAGTNPSPVFPVTPPVTSPVTPPVTLPSSPSSTLPSIPTVTPPSTPAPTPSPCFTCIM